MFLGDTQLVGRADHGVARNAADFARLELSEHLGVGMAVKKNGAGQGDDDGLPAVAHLQVGSSGDDGLRPGGAVVHGGQRQPVCIRVTLDGHDLRGLTLRSVREQVSLVQQETVLFGLSIAENVR